MLHRIAIALDQESTIINPELVCGTAARGLLGKTVTIAKARRNPLGTRRQRRARHHHHNLALRGLRPTTHISKDLRALSAPYASRLRSLSDVAASRLNRSTPWFFALIASTLEVAVGRASFLAEMLGRQQWCPS